MIMIRFGRWSRAGGKIFTWQRIYFKGYKWTPFVLIKRRKQSTLESMRQLMGIQGSNGNWDYDPYMQGMYNGMELMLAIQEDREPVYKKAPAEWLCDKSDSSPPIPWSDSEAMAGEPH